MANYAGFCKACIHIKQEERKRSFRMIPLTMNETQNFIRNGMGTGKLLVEVPGQLLGRLSISAQLWGDAQCACVGLLMFVGGL